jgi:hypothetical protein
LAFSLFSRFPYNIQKDIPVKANCPPHFTVCFRDQSMKAAAYAISLITIKQVEDPVPAGRSCLDADQGYFNRFATARAARIPLAEACSNPRVMPAPSPTANKLETSVSSLEETRILLE